MLDLINGIAMAAPVPESDFMSACWICIIRRLVSFLSAFFLASRLKPERVHGGIMK
jgi:hypothetical protein